MKYLGGVVLLLFALAAGPALAQTSAPTIVNSQGYINGDADGLLTSPSMTFNSQGATTLVLFVSGHPFWPQPNPTHQVSISSVADNVGNTWNVLVGPTTFAGSSFTLMSAVYYVNAPSTSATHTITVNLTGDSPWVMQVFAVSGADTSGPPLFSPITDPGTGSTSSNVISQPITVSANSLLLAWVKNELNATATALDGWTLDSASSTSFLWAAHETASSTGAYDGHFSYSNPIGWQTAIVGLQPAPPTPVAQSQSVTTDQDTPVNITLTAASPNNSPLTYTVLTQPVHGQLSPTAPNLTYTPNAGYSGSDSFTFKANDGTADSNVATVSITVRPPSPPPTAGPPTVVNSQGYLNGDADGLLTSPSMTFNSVGASTLVLFVSGHPFWPQPTDSTTHQVSISSVADNVGNTWNVLVGPTTFAGSSFTLMSAVYYVNAPVTSATHTVTVNLTGDSPWVMQVFAVSGADTSGPPLFSPITAPGTGSSSDVISQPITVSANSLLLAWVKNETSATATALDGWTLDSASTSFLWAAHETASSAGAHDGHFSYSNPIGWQTAIVGLQPAPTTAPPTPTISSTPANPTNQTSASFSFSDTQAGVSFLCKLDVSAFTACSSPTAYSSLSQGSHTFSVKAQDSAGNQSSAASFTWTINTTAPPTPTISSTPANPTNQTSASFSFSDTQAGVSFLCQLDGSAFSACTSPTTYSGLAQGSHTFSVKAQDTAGNQSSAASFTWTIDTTAPPKPKITSTPANPTNQTSASFSFTDNQAGVSFLCQLDGSAFGACTSPTTYSGLAQGSHTFSVKAQDTAGNQSAAASFTWTVNVTAPPTPTITSTPANPTNQTSASFSFSDTQAGVSFLCQLDGSAFSACASPKAYSGLSPGSHTFSVKAQDAAGNQSAAASFTWTINNPAPPTPTITSGPANPTNQASASFSFSDTQAGVSFLCQLDGSAFSACTSPTTYSGLAQGSHTFSVKAQDAAGNQSGPASYTWTVDTTAPPTPTITSAPTNPTSQTSASFSFTDTEAGVSFLCQLDGSAFSACASPKAYSGLSPGSHTFSVKAQDAVGNQSAAASFTWTINTAAPPAPTITSAPANPTNQTSASFSFTDTQAGVSFLCQLDGGAFSSCASPTTYAGLSEGSHTFSVKAQDAAGNQSGPTTYTWTIDTTPPQMPTITSEPASSTKQTSAQFKFTDTEAGVSFLCQLDGSAFSTCSSPQNYSGLSRGSSHTFSVKAQDAARNQSVAASFTWTITP